MEKAIKMLEEKHARLMIHYLEKNNDLSTLLNIDDPSAFDNF